jgi:hypothetical protein
VSDRRPLLFDIDADPGCTNDAWDQHVEDGERLRRDLRAYLSLSQVLLAQDRLYPGTAMTTEQARR